MPSIGWTITKKKEHNMPGRIDMNMLKNAILTSGYKALGGLAVMVVLACTACSTPQGPGSAPGNVVYGKTVEEPKETQSHTESENLEIEAAKNTVKRYWISANSSYEDMYELFSSSYKEILSQFDGIINAEDFRESIPATERIWSKQTYQSATLDVSSDPPQMQIVVLADWEEEGYAGVMTYIFELIKEGDDWKIANIMF
jgi:hypothetical protein